MDPNAALKAIRDFVRQVDDGEFVLSDIDSFVCYVRGLDEWICAGGFLPTQWTVALLPTGEARNDR